MPRIPEAAFDTMPSTRVETPRIVNPDDGTKELRQGVQNLSQAMAVFQDQRERSEAIEHADLVKKQYTNLKTTYAMALQNVKQSGDANGNYVLPDPTDDNPDVAKRRVVTGNINDLYSKMQETVEQGKSFTQNLYRSDIANKLIDDSVVTDLGITKTRQDETLFHIRQKNIYDNYLTSLSDMANNIALDVEAGVNPQTMKMRIDDFERSIVNRINLNSTIMGDKGVKDMLANKDKAFESVIKSVLDKDYSESAVVAADAALAKINNPTQKKFLAARMDSYKKDASNRVLSQVIGAATKLSEDIRKSPMISDSSYNEALTGAQRTISQFRDGKLTTIPKESQIDAAVTLTASASSKKFFADSITDNMDFFNSAEPEDIAKQDEIIDKLIDDVETTGIVSMDDGFKGKLKERLRNEIRLQQSAMVAQKHIPAIVSYKYPHLQGDDRYRMIELINEQKGYGQPRFLGDEEAKAFQNDFNETLNTLGPDAAHLMFSQRVPSGEYSRAIAMELIGGKKDMAYLVTASDVPTHLRDDIIKNHSLAEAKKKDATSFLKGMGEEMAEFKFNLNVDQANSTLYQGYVQAIMDEAIANSNSKDEFMENLDVAKEKYSKHFVTMKQAGIGGRSEIFINNNAQDNVIQLDDKNFIQVDYTSSESKNYISTGLNVAHTLPTLSMDQKVQIASKIVGDKAASDIGRDEIALNQILRKSMVIKSDPTKANRYNVHFGEVGKEDSLVKYDKSKDERGFTISYSANQLYLMGIMEKQKQEDVLSDDSRSLSNRVKNLNIKLTENIKKENEEMKRNRGL